MFGSVAGVGVAACLLAACGASTGSGSSTAQSPGPVESVSDSGELAYRGATSCPPGPPASGFLNAVGGDPEHDGVVGTVRNETSYRIFLIGKTYDDFCSIEPGQRAAYAASDQVALKIRNDGTKRSTTVTTYVYVTDPNTGDPTVSVGGYEMGKSNDLPCYVKSGSRVTLDEGSTQEVGPIGSGTLWAQRHDDDKNIAREWTGADSWAVNDWARIDLMVKPVDVCE